MYRFLKRIYRFFVKICNIPHVMRIKNILKRAEKLIPYYQDDISVRWLRAREKFIQERDITVFARTGKALKERDYEISEIGEHPVTVVYKEKNDAIAKYTRLIMGMSRSGKKCRFFSINEYVNGHVGQIGDEEILVPAMDRESIYDFLTVARNHGDWNRLMLPQYDMLVGFAGGQYFDIFSPVENEIFIDAGAFDGQTELEILKWGGSNIKRIYAFEADPANFEQCKAYYEEHGLTEKVKFIGKGLWKEHAVMRIGNGQCSAGSQVSSDGKNEIEVTTLDDEAGDEKITFIKMDIEGAELNALKGAKKTIVKYKPRLAICIYHKPEDICEIPEYIRSIVPEYRFWVRHYATNEWETVLYAKCP